jgi:hypothetical protein
MEGDKNGMDIQKVIRQEYWKTKGRSRYYRIRER